MKQGGKITRKKSRSFSPRQACPGKSDIYVCMQVLLRFVFPRFEKEVFLFCSAKEVGTVGNAYEWASSFFPSLCVSLFLSLLNGTVFEIKHSGNLEKMEMYNCCLRFFSSFSAFTYPTFFCLFEFLFCTTGRQTDKAEQTKAVRV